MAFKPTARPLDAQTVEVRYEIAKGYYLYRDKFRFFAVEGDAAKAGTPQFPKGKEKNDENFGKGRGLLPGGGHPGSCRTQRRRAIGPGLKVTSQGCADAGVCYPQAQVVSLELPAPGSTRRQPAPRWRRNRPHRPGPEKHRLLGQSAFFFIAGLGLALTPSSSP